MRDRPYNERGGAPKPRTPDTDSTDQSHLHFSPRLAEDGISLLTEAEERLEALEAVCANALLEDSYAALVEACTHAIVQSSSARRFQSAVVVRDLVAVA